MRYLQRTNGVTGALLDIPRSVDDLFHRFWNGAEAPAAASWHAPVDVVETAEHYVLRLEIPGVDPDLVEVTQKDDTLTVRGTRNAPEKVEGEQWHLRERVHGSFERTFTLPRGAATREIEAEARHGVLTIRIAKAKEAQPQRIAVRKA